VVHAWFALQETESSRNTVFLSHDLDKGKFVVFGIGFLSESFEGEPAQSKIFENFIRPIRLPNYCKFLASKTA
jgi:hypothetical protein